MLTIIHRLRKKKSIFGMDSLNNVFETFVSDHFFFVK